MTTDSFPVVQRRARTGIGLLLASALLHVALINWADGNIGLPSFGEQQQTVMTAELHASQTVREAPAPPAPKPIAKAKPKPRPRPTPSPPVVAVTQAPAETSPPAPTAITAPETSDEPVEEIPVVETPEPAPAAAVQEPAEPRYKVNPPPSAELKYDVEDLRNGQTTHGRGKLSWQMEGNHYTAGGEAGILFITLMKFKSTGEINEFGVAPVLYSEKRIGKSETNTHFHRERNIISFSASEASYPRRGGEQDRVSIIWQLVGIGRGDGEKFFPGAEINIFVAGLRDAEAWRIQVIGQEEIAIGSGKTTAWHVARVPRPGSYDRKLDIWLAPQKEWYPVRVRHTETNGDYLDMLLSNVNLAVAR